MLRTNSKKAINNIRLYIINNFTPENYTDTPPQTFPEIAKFILDVFNSEKPAIGSYARMSENERFLDWCQGLPSVLDTCYWYNRSAVDDLGEILEETETEKSQYGEEKAGILLTCLIHRELRKAIK